MNNNTIKPALKKCSGTGKAKGYGCKESALNRKYGLCRKCLVEWSLTTEAGNEYLRSISLKAKKKVKQEEKQRIKSEKESIKKKSEYEEMLQKEVNKLARYIDYENGCISCNHGHESKWTRRKNGGHYHSVGNDASLRFNLFNIYLQCVRCNKDLGGNQINYRKGVIEMHGTESMDILEGLKSKYPLIKLSIPDLKECIKKARHIIRDIENGRDYSRSEVNEILGIYK